MDSIKTYHQNECHIAFSNANKATDKAKEISIFTFFFQNYNSEVRSLAQLPQDSFSVFPLFILVVLLSQFGRAREPCLSNLLRIYLDDMDKAINLLYYTAVPGQQKNLKCWILRGKKYGEISTVESTLEIRREHLRSALLQKN